MKAILGYHYGTGRWGVLDIMAGPLTASAETYKRCQIDRSIYTEIIEAPIKSGSIDKDGTIDVTLGDDYVLPYVLTLEESIKKNKAVLMAYRV